MFHASAIQKETKAKPLHCRLDATTGSKSSVARRLSALVVHSRGEGMATLSMISRSIMAKGLSDYEIYTDNSVCVAFRVIHGSGSVRAGTYMLSDSQKFDPSAIDLAR